MSEKDTRIIPPGHFGSPFLDPSGSMSMGEDGETISTTYMVGPGGTNTASAVQTALDAISAERKPGPFDHLCIIVTDGEPPASLHESHGDVLSALMRQAGPFHFICLDEPAISDLSQIAAHDRQRPREDGVLTADEIGRLPSCQRAASEMFGITGNGLAPVPSASELVTRICSTVDGVAEPALTDQCLGCGGCDKK